MSGANSNLITVNVLYIWHEPHPTDNIIQTPKRLWLQIRIALVRKEKSHAIYYPPKKVAQIYVFNNWQLI